MATYFPEEIRNKTAEALQTPATLYAQRFVRYIGKTGGERYTEIAARELLAQNNLELLRGIPAIDRANYATPGHESLAQQPKPKATNQEEKWIARRLYGKKLDVLGTIIDFETPLKRTSADTAGKIDLLVYNDLTQTMTILEFKRPKSKETLLRCVLEIFTYSKLLNTANLFTSFGKPADTALRKAVLVYEGCQAHRDFHAEDCPFVRQLMRELGVDFFVLNNTDDGLLEAHLWDTP
jgi:hypothetical protein